MNRALLSMTTGLWSTLNFDPIGTLPPCHLPDTR
jgi:hypothetical protein